MAFLSVSLQLKRSHRKPEERVSPAGAVSPLNYRRITWGSCGPCLERISLTLYNASGGAGRAHNILDWKETEKKLAFHAFQSEYIFYLAPAHMSACKPLLPNYVLYFTMTK